MIYDGNLEGLTFDDVLLKPQRGVLNTRSEADISVPSLGLRIPLIAAPMPSVASVNLIKEIDRLGGRGVVHRMNRTAFEAVDDFDDSEVKPAVAVGLNRVDVHTLHGCGVRTLVLDVAHAHSERAIDFIKYVSNTFPDIFVIAGNVATAEASYDLTEAGAHAIKVGIGPGSVCTTRQVTGFGVPQLQAIYEVRGATGLPVIADGGIRNSGDIVKALAAGADAVMIGSLFAHSIEANNGGLHYGCASERVNGHNAPEGIEAEVEGVEPLETIVKRLTWGIRSGISYAGATSIAELQEAPQWIRLTDAGRRESKLA